MKKVTWGPAKTTSANRAPGTYGSYKELMQKSAAIQSEQREAEEYLMKAMPVMVALLEYKLKHQEPLIVMRPLRYQTSEIVKGDSIDDAFYRGNSQTEKVNDKFTDTIKTILPGTRLMLKSLDLALQEFVFEDGNGKEHALNFVERNNLMTQTNVFEEIKNYFENKGE